MNRHECRIKICRIGMFLRLFQPAKTLCREGMTALGPDTRVEFALTEEMPQKDIIASCQQFFRTSQTVCRMGRIRPGRHRAEYEYPAPAERSHDLAHGRVRSTAPCPETKKQDIAVRTCRVSLGS